MLIDDVFAVMECLSIDTFTLAWFSAGSVTTLRAPRAILNDLTA